VLSMDTTFDTTLMWRSITSPVMQIATYYFIIAWEILTAIICWIGCFILLSKIKENNSRFNESKKIAFIGLFFGFLLYMVGFIIIGSEWFNMWQSRSWNGQMTAGLFISMIMFVMIFLKIGTNNEQ
jgi:predicted small integral membrane protein